MRVLIQGIYYKIEFINESERVMNGNNVHLYGLCDYIKNVITINTYCKNKKRILQTIEHELSHAYFFEWTGDNHFEDIDEMLAEFTSRFARKIIEQADKIYGKIYNGK